MRPDGCTRRRSAAREPALGHDPITPYLLYEDVGGALAWLAKAFGFRERMRLPGPDGRIAHAEMVLADGLVMIGCPGPTYQNPKRSGHVTQPLYVYADNVDTHCEQARRAGAAIVEEPKHQFYGDRAMASRIRKGTTGISPSALVTSPSRR